MICNWSLIHRRIKSVPYRTAAKTEGTLTPPTVGDANRPIVVGESADFFFAIFSCFLMFSVLRKSRKLLLPIDMQLQLFDSMIVPIFCIVLK